jgi:hypothetical protein
MVTSLRAVSCARAGRKGRRASWTSSPMNAAPSSRHVALRQNAQSRAPKILTLLLSAGPGTRTPSSAAARPEEAQRERRHAEELSGPLERFTKTSGRAVFLGAGIGSEGCWR